MDVIKFPVPSSTVPDQVWTVSKYVYNDGAVRWGCDCPRFVFNTEPNFECKHIEKIKTKGGEQQ